ncbi:hypothetical protein OG819_04950 [Streptomyces sp. NBC_01549]|uniref:hypothetical protein n=1 Tax=Streptomyces sp. NBC_01549 TaxID=2975874 RepID=UPI002252EBF9|nr:hypothetical protein [Streptomyces sp. NBC_01549]MCX4589117.1 hypothetical protein [Streptomyces sp. NBC_01549]
MKTSTSLSESFKLRKSVTISERVGKALQGNEMQNVSRDELLAAFELDTEAGVAARNALISGAHFDLWLDPVPAVEILGICSARKRNLQRRGKQTLGFTETLAILRQMGEQGLLVAYVNDRDRGGYYFQLFLDPDSLKVIGCIGVNTFSGDDPATDRV